MTSDAVQGAREPIAIVGIGCRLPGAVDGPEVFWERLLDGFDAIEEVPADRFDVGQWFDARPATPGRIMSRWGGFVRPVDAIDAEFFRLAPREAERLDPQQRLLLETSWEALEDAGIAADRLAGSDTGVFVGLWLHDFESRLFADAAGVDFHMTTGSGAYSASGRLSYVLDLGGPSLTIDTACSSSLVAVHLACQALRTGECTLALAGGANVILQPHITVAYSQSRMMAPDGRCKFGDAAADGYVRSDGAAMVVLKTLRAALADGDPIYAVIRGSAVTNDGSTSGFLATPGQAGQEAMLRRAYARAGVPPSGVQYVEAHGTGTAAGDPVECGALGAVVGAGRPVDAPCLVGSVKSNIGHTEGAAGVAGLIKAALALHHGTIPPSLHVREANPAIPWDEHHLAVCATTREWPTTDGPRRAGVSAFGIAGTNAHVVLEEAPQRAPATVPSGGDVLVLPVSARNEAALIELARRWRDRLAAASSPAEVAALCATAARRRAHHDHRLAVVARDPADLARGLTAVVDGEDDPATSRGRGTLVGPTVFVFPGQGGQWQGMGRQLLASNPVFHDAVVECSRAMEPYLGRSIADQLAAGTPDIDDIDVVQPALFAMQVGLAAVWRSWGVEPDAVVGHSLGEVAAAVVAGALSVHDGAKVIATRSTLLRRISGQGAMAVVELAHAAAEQAIRGREAELAVAVSNSATSSVLAGTPAALDAVLATLEAAGVFCRRIKVDVASHSPQVEPLLPELRQALADLRPGSAAVDFWSTVDGRVVAGSALDADYWVRNLRQPVRFGAAVEGLLDRHAATFVEMGSHPVLLHPIEATARDRAQRIAAVCSIRRDADEPVAVLGALAELYARGVTIDWDAVVPAAPPTPAPTYPWQRERHWWEPPASSAAARPAAREHPLLGWRVPIADPHAGPLWENELDSLHHAELYEHRVGGAPSVAASALLEAALAAADRSAGTAALTDVQFERMVLLDEQAPTRIQVRVASSEAGAALTLHTLSAAGANRHVSARLAPAPGPIVPPAAPPDATTITDQPYAGLQSSGVAMGRAVVRRLSMSGDTVVADIDAGAGERSSGALEACMHTVATGVGHWLGDGSVWIPVAAASVVAASGGDGVARCIVQFSGDAASGVTATATALDATGSPVLQLQGLVLQPLGSAAPRVEDHCYEVAWLADDSAPADVSGSGAPVVVVAGDAVAAAVGDALGAAGRVVDVVAAGDADALAAAVGRHGAAGVVHVVHLAALDTDSAPPRPDDGDRRDAVIGVCADLACTARALDDAGTPTRLWIVTRGGQHVAAPSGSGARPLDLAHAAAWGMARAIHEEMPHLWGGLVDLDPGAAAPDAAQCLVAELGRTDGDDAAWRDGVRHVARLARIADLPAAALRFDPGSAVLVTGGFGAVGSRTAMWLAERGARHLVLLARTPLPARAEWATQDPASRAGAMVRLVQDLERAGTHVHAVAVDLCSTAALGAFLEGYRAEARPPIRAVFHTAAVFESALVREVDREQLGAQFAAKAFGAHRLSDALPDVDLFVCFSSIAALLPQPYQGAYAAANSFLDGLAHARRARGRHALSVDWGVWQGAAGAIVGEQWEHRARQIEAQGMQPFSPRLGLDALDRLLAAGLAQAAFAPFRWDVYAAARQVQPLVSVVAAPVDRSGADVPADDGLRARLRTAHPSERLHLLDDSVRAITAQVLRMPPRRIDPDRPFGALGVDSLMAIEIRNRIEAETGVALSATVIWNHPTVAELAAHVLTRVEADAGGPEPAAAGEPSTGEARPSGTVEEIVAASEALLDDDVLRLLLGGDS